VLKEEEDVKFMECAQMWQKLFGCSKHANNFNCTRIVLFGGLNPSMVSTFKPRLCCYNWKLNVREKI
jgi:hypothetical protein